jgi:multidrug efflux pump subunit AcrA (membrane-fusion protein)
VKRGLLLLAGLVGLGALAMGARAAFSRLSTDASDVPVLQVRRAPFSRTVSAEGYLRPVRATPLTAPSEGRSLLIAWMAEDGARVKKGEVVIRFDSDQALRELADGKDDESAALTRIAKEKVAVESSLAERARAAALTRDEMVKARELGKKDPRFFPRSEVIESEIDEGLLDARLEQNEATRKVERQLGHSRVALLAVDKQKAVLELAEANRTLEALEVRAPHDGIFVVQRMGWAQRTIQAGDRAFPGMRIAEVATSDRMDAEVMVLEADAGGLTAGKRAQVILDARADLVLAAKVKKVDAFPKPKHPEVPAQYFGALLSIHGSGKDKGQDKDKDKDKDQDKDKDKDKAGGAAAAPAAGMKPGQRLRATLVLDELPSALVVPRQAVFRKPEGTFVHRRRRWRGGFDPVAVTLGPGTVGRVVVTAGLDEGDVIALRDPGRRAEEVSAPPPAERSGVGRAPPEGMGRGRRGGGP